MLDKKTILLNHIPLIIINEIVINMSRREKSEIIKDILTLSEIPRGKTDIVYKCNLNFNIVKKYLNGCINSGWIEEENLGFKKVYRTTELGKQVLDTLAQSVSLIHF